MERYRSMRRWWNDPVAEDRRQWNRARFDMMRRMSDERSRAMTDWSERQREYTDQFRPGTRGPFGGPRLSTYRW